MKKNEPPMWTDADEPTAAVPLTKDEVSAVRAADFIRAVDANGRTSQGQVTGVRGLGNGHVNSIIIGGIDWLVQAHTFYRVSPMIVQGRELVQEIMPPRVAPSVEELRDVVVDLVGPDLRIMDKAELVTLDRIIWRILGYDPSTGQANADFGGKSKEGWQNQHFAVAQTKKLLAELVDAGVLRAVKDGTYYKPSEDRRYVSFPSGSRVGWTTTEMYETAKAVRAANLDAQRLADLRKEACAIVAGRHSDEVEAELALLIAAYRANR